VSARPTFAEALAAAISRNPTRTVVALAAELGVPNNSLTTWLKGRHHPRPGILSNILRRARLTMDEREGMLEEYFDTRMLREIGLTVHEPYTNLSATQVAATAKLLHETFRRLGEGYGYDAYDPDVDAWEVAPENARLLMQAVVRDLASRGIIIPT
jgi:hypothetical protein